MVLTEHILKGEVAADAAAELVELRIKCWEPFVKDASILNRFHFDAFDRVSTHYCLRNSLGELVAASRICFLQEQEMIPDAESFEPFMADMHFPVAFFNRAVVEPERRGQNLAQRMTAARLELVKQVSVTEVWIETRSSSIPFLLLNDFKVLGESGDTEIKGGWMIARKKINS